MSRPAPISHSSPDVGEQEIRAAIECLRSQHLKGGKRMRDLEEQVAHDLGYLGAVATTSCTQALHLALRVMSRGDGAEVGLPSYVCRSVYDAIRLAKDRPRLLDIDPGYLSVSLAQARRLRLKAVIVPHMFGIRAPIEDFMNAGLRVIEDCAQRLTPPEVARMEPKAPLRVLSFEATKLLTCGEGGLLLCDHIQLLERARRLRDGQHDSTGSSLWIAMTDLQAAIALVQWRRLPSLLKRRRRLAADYIEALGLKFTDRIVPAMRAKDTYHFRFVLRSYNPVAFMERTFEEGVITRRPVAPAPLHRLLKDRRRFPTTQEAFDHLVSIPLYPRLTSAEAERVASTTTAALARDSAQ